MKKKKILTCFSILGVVSSLSFGVINVNAESILPNDKPEIIQEQSDLSGKVNSLMEKQSDKMNNLTIKNQEELNSAGSGSVEGGEELMNPDAFLEDTDMTISDFGNVIISRMLDVVSFFQNFAKPFTIIMFILSALLVVVSMVFGTKNAKLGFLGMMLSIFAYVGAMYAPDLVLFFAQWLSV